MKDIKISMPLYVDIPYKRKQVKPKRYYFNLNNYRNWHVNVKNNIKKQYSEIARKKLVNIKPKTPVILTFILWKKDKRKGDRSNVLSIHEKFFCDALVECGCIIDDNDTYIESSHYYTGGIDKENPRVEIIIQEKV